MNDVSTPPPARPERLKVRFAQSGDRLWMVYRPRGVGGGFFLLFWLIGWTVGCVVLAGLVIHEPKAFHLLFAIPFWASWVFVFFMVLKMFFQCEEFLLDGEGVVFLRRVFVPIHRREVPLSEVKEFTEYSRVTDSEHGTMTYGLEMRTLGNPLQFGEGLPEPERTWLVYMFQEHLAGLHVAYGGPQPAPVAAEAAAGDAAGVVESRESQTSHGSAAPCEPPSDTRWQRMDDFDKVTFMQRGRLSLASLFGVLFVNLFWNGIVGVFVLELFGKAPGNPQLGGAEWWGLFVFLIPFEAAGLVMIVALIAVLLEPVRRTTWSFGRSSVECHWKWLGVGPSWTYNIAALDRIDLHEHKSSSGKHRNPPQVMNYLRGQGAFRASFVDKSNCEVCSIKGLTEGEARWMADVVRRERPIWFR